jgi:arsenate reductase (glutaredoxin)
VTDRKGVPTYMEFYGYKKCSTCRDAHKALVAKGIDIPFHDFVVSPPSKEQLREWIRKRGEGVMPFVNTKGTQYKALGLKEKQLSDDEWIELLSQDGKLIKRPVLVTDETVIVGFDKAAYENLPAKD